MRKYFLILGLFLVTGFLFLNATNVLAADVYWTGNAATSTYGGKDFWNPSNWDTGVPSSNDNIWLFATSSPNSTVVISTPVNLGTGNIHVGYNQKGNTLANSSAPLTLLIREGASLSNTGKFTVGTSSTVLLTSGSLSVGTTTIKQAASTTIDSITGATSTVTIAGDFTLGSAAQYTSPANSTTTLNLPSGTSGTDTFYAATSTPTFGYLVFGGTGTTNSQISSMTVANRLSIAAGRTLTAGGGTITLSGSNSNSMTFPLEITGTFTAATSTITYTGTGATTVASTTYATVNWNGATTYTLGGGTTVSTAGTIASGATLAVSTYTLTATGATWTNNGTVTESTGGSIKNAATSVQFTNSSGAALSSVNADGNGSVYLTVTDPDQNLLPSIETLSATITAKSGISTTQTATLTETSASSGIFRGGLTFTLSGTAVGGALAYQGPGTLNYSWTDAQDSSDTSSCTGCATFTGTSPGGGSGSGSSSSASTGSTSGTTSTTSTTATTGTTSTSETTTTTTTTTTETPGASSETAAVTTPAAPTLDSIQSKIASAIAKAAALTKNSPAADIAAVQSEIADILKDIQALQAASPAPQGVALGFNFVRPLALGMSSNDVKNLQKALKTDSSVYPEGLVTGYFGPATLRAVKKFQEKFGIASSGEAGYGNVGPKTRTKLNELYGGK